MLICVSTLPWLLILYSCVLETEAGDRRVRVQNLSTTESGGFNKHTFS